MARRTYRRSVSYNELSTKQLNALAGQDQYIATFSGLNTGKNYTTIDQNSFSDTNNMYIDTDECLSTRPPIETVQDSKYSLLHIVSYKAINGINFFVIDEEGSTKLVSDLGYDDSLITLGDITTNGKLFFVNGKYIIFDTDRIWGFSIDYSSKSYTKYTEEDLIYIPTSYDLNPRNDTEIAKNIFTPNTFEQIIYTVANVTGESNPPDDGKFINKEVIIHMDGKDYKRKWTSNQWRTFVYELYSGEVIDKCTNIEFSRDGKYVVAFTPKNIGDKTFSEGFYFSENGGETFTLIENPCDNTDLGRTISLSEDGVGLLYVGYNGQKDNATVYIAYSDFPIDGVSFNWNKYDDKPEATTYFNTFTRNIKYKDTYPYCFAFQNYDPNVENIIAHCVNAANFVVCFGQNEGDKFAVTTYYTRDPSSTEPQSESLNYSSALPILIHAYVEGTWHYALHYSRNRRMSNNTTICSSYILPDKSRVRMISDKEGNCILNIGYFTNGIDSSWSRWLRTELIKVVVTKEEGFAPGIFEGTHVERKYGSIAKNTYCGLVTSLIDSPIISSKRENAIDDDNWTDTIGVLTNIQGILKYDYLQLTPGSSLDYGVYDVTSYGNYDKDHKNVVNLSEADSGIRASAYNYLSVSTDESQFEQYSTPVEGNNSAISLGSVLMQKFIRSTKAGFLGKNGSISYFQDTVRPLYVDSNGNFVYMHNGVLYKNGIRDNDEVTVTIDNGSTSYNYLIPDFVNEIVTNNFTFIFGDSIYQSYYGDGKLYVPEYTKDTLEGEITNVTRFSDVSLGIFLENSVYEYQYSSDLTSQAMVPSFTRHPTKLQLGCLKGSDIVHTYDGVSIIMTTKRGVAILNYQQFVQSTEQVYTFLSNNIDDYYEKWSKKYTTPIKITLFKDYIIFYQTDNINILVFDTRNTSWWPWKLSETFKVFADIDSTLSLIPTNLSIVGLKMLNFDNKTNYMDYNGSLIKWNFETQPLHFNAPAFYKHVSRFSIITTDKPSKIAFDLKFITYKNLNNLTDFEILFEKTEMLTTIIKRINFLKLNALKISCSSNDEYTKSQFISSALIIHYRPTEVIR